MAVVACATQVMASDIPIEIGERLFMHRCALCHGESGRGDGKMAKIITNPPPFDLTRSVMPPEYLVLIIERGGEPLNRSPQMPPWQGELSRQQIESIVEYLLVMRSGVAQNIGFDGEQ